MFPSRRATGRHQNHHPSHSDSLRRPRPWLLLILVLVCLPIEHCRIPRWSHRQSNMPLLIRHSTQHLIRRSPQQRRPTQLVRHQQSRLRRLILVHVRRMFWERDGMRQPSKVTMPIRQQRIQRIVSIARASAIQM